MKKHAFKLLLLCCSIIAGPQLKSQVIIRPDIGNAKMYSIGHALNVNLTNASGTSLNGIIEIRIKDHVNNGAYQISSQLISLNPGQILGSQEIEWEGGVDLQSLVTVNAFFEDAVPSGQFEFCYRFIEASSGRSMGNHCQDNPFVKLQRPELIYPKDGQILHTAVPVMSWRPPLPLEPGNLSYAIKITELELGQIAEHAINTNIPVIQQVGIRVPSFTYPNAGIPLEPDQRYVWEVEAYYNGRSVGKTEVKEFTVGEIIEEEIEEEEEAFRGVKKVRDGSFYVFSKNIYMAYDNRSYETALNYTIREKGNSKRKIKKIPNVELVPGMNNITIEGKGLRLRNNTEYVLEIKDPKGIKYYLEFKKSR